MSTKRGKEAILSWCQKATQEHNVEIKNLSTSFADGLAFAAIIDSVCCFSSILVDLIDLYHYSYGIFNWIIFG